MIVLLLIVFGLIFGSFAVASMWRIHSSETIQERLEELRHKRQTLEESKSSKKKKTAKANTETLTKEISELEAELETLSISKGRSMCSNCRHPLAPKDLVPLFSWLWLKGKCRYCHEPIQDTPLLEAGLPVAFVVSYILWPMPLTFNSLHQSYGAVAFIVWLIMLVGFALLTAYDIRWFLLPDKVVWPLAALALAQVIAHATLFGGGPHVLWVAFWGVVMCSGIFYVLHKVSDGAWIGGGDVKLGIILGLLVGGPLPGLLVVFVASLLGTIASIPMLLQKKLQRTSIIPFGPFLMLATVIIVLVGQKCIDWLQSVLLLS